jgi:hypothetical protein
MGCQGIQARVIAHFKRHGGIDALSATTLFFLAKAIGRFLWCRTLANRLTARTT